MEKFNQLENLYGYVMHKPSLLACKLVPTTNLVTHVDSQCPFDSTLSRGDKTIPLILLPNYSNKWTNKNIPFGVPPKTI